MMKAGNQNGRNVSAGSHRKLLQARVFQLAVDDDVKTDCATIVHLAKRRNVLSETLMKIIKMELGALVWFMSPQRQLAAFFSPADSGARRAGNCQTSVHLAELENASRCDTTGHLAECWNRHFNVHFLGGD